MSISAAKLDESRVLIDVADEAQRRRNVAQGQLVDVVSGPPLDLDVGSARDAVECARAVGAVRTTQW